MERECDNCKYKMNGIEEHPCVKCIRNATDMWEQETNADRIRTMNDVELAEFLTKQFCHGVGEKLIFDWLKSPIDNRKEQG